MAIIFQIFWRNFPMNAGVIRRVLNTLHILEDNHARLIRGDCCVNRDRSQTPVGNAHRITESGIAEPTPDASRPSNTRIVDGRSWGFHAPMSPAAAQVVMPAQPRIRPFFGMACIPFSGIGWQSAGALIAMLLALLLGVQLIRWLGRRLRRGRRPLRSNWTEEFRLSRQRERIVRQSIRSNVPGLYVPSTPVRRDAMRST